MPPTPAQPDPWTRLRRLTPARVALGRAGGSLPTAELLDFAAAHAAARDAVWSVLDGDALAADLAPLGIPVLTLDSAAPDRATYLQRPDLGRSLSDDSRARLLNAASSLKRPPGPPDVALILSDGLSATACQRQAAATLAHLVPLLRADGLSLAPLVVVRRARVGIADEVGAILAAQAAVILLGERPGLGSPDSLGAYLVFAPSPGKTDADRNCVSNIRPEGLPPAAAARTLRYLIIESIRRKVSGVSLKDDRPAALTQGPVRAVGEIATRGGEAAS